MRGRRPKPPELRQRRNKTTTAAVLKVAPPQLAIAPVSTKVAPPPPPRPRTAGKATTPRAAAKAKKPAPPPPQSRRRAPKAKNARDDKAPPLLTPPPPAAAAPELLPLSSAPELPPFGQASFGAEPIWHPQTLAWWEEIWASPMAAQWLAADRHVLNRLAVLVNEFWHRPTVSLLGEIGKQEARFGLTPMDRHRLQWKIEVEAGPATAVEEDEEQQPMTDPRETLRLVK